MNQGQLNQGQGFGLGPLANVREWSTFEWLNYQFAPRLSAGVGAGFTYDNLSVGPDMTSEEYQGRIKWQATDKISLVLSGGLNDMQFLNSSVPDLLSPVFSASVLYQLFLPTTLSVSASRATTPSYFENAVTEVTSVSAGLHQRLLGRLYLDVTGGYGSTSYTGSAVGFNGANLSSYDLASINVSLSTTFLRRASAAVYFQENILSSGATGAASSFYNYTTTQVGLSLGYRF